MNYQRCVKCGKELGTGDINGICQSCRNQGINEFNAKPIPSGIAFETKQPLQLGDTFQADGNEWKVTTYPDNSIYLELKNRRIKIALRKTSFDKGLVLCEQYICREFECGWFSTVMTFDEIKMVAEIIDKLKE